MRLGPAVSSLAAALLITSPALGQDIASASEERAAIAVADSVLVALSTADSATLRRLILDSAVVGGAGARGTWLGAWTPYINSGKVQFIERGFDATARVQDRVAMVWMPYDLYLGTTWSHCGVDLFTLVNTPAGWRVASLVYTLEQPPACRKHPAGPPG